MVDQRTIRRSMIGLTVIVILGLLIGIWAVKSHVFTSPIGEVETYYQAIVVYDQPLDGHYEMMPVRHHSLSLDANRVLPYLQLPQTSVDFGELQDGMKAEHTFRLHNVGQGLLRIEQLYTTCSCLIAHLTSGVIPSGKMALLSVEFDPSQVDVATVEMIGVRYGVFMTSNDPHWSQASVWIEAELLSDTF